MNRRHFFKLAAALPVVGVAVVKAASEPVEAYPVLGMTQLEGRRYLINYTWNFKLEISEYSLRLMNPHLSEGTIQKILGANA